LHKLLNVRLVELKVETPQFRVVVDGVVVGSRAGTVGLKFRGV
jgi:hypothetical protein